MQIVVLCLSLLHGFAKKNLNSDSAHRQWILIFGEHLKRVICLGYWRAKQRKCLAWENETKARVSLVERKPAKLMR